MRYQIVDEYRKQYPVSVVCETLGVSLSGYYAWKKRPVSQHQQEDQHLAEQIQAVYHSCQQVYGSPRILAELREQGITSSRKRGARLLASSTRQSSTRFIKHRQKLQAANICSPNLLPHSPM